MRIFAVAAIITLSLPLFLVAQSAPTRLLLVVDDPTGAPVTDAYVQVQHWLPPTLSAKASVVQDGSSTADEKGEVSFNLASGHYEVFVSSRFFLPAAAHVLVRRGVEN